MKPTYIVNLFGGPGSGKSTTAAGLFYEMKCNGESVELVREYCKDWAWTNRPIGKWDGLYFMAKQLHSESALYGKVDTVITDAPVMLQAVYETLYFPGHPIILPAVREIIRQQEADGIYRIDCMVLRQKAYVPAGRNETEEQARKVDDLCREMLPGMYEVRSVDDAYRALKDMRSHY